MRFYSSYPREMREVFNRKDLHLGHYAKSFALREPPQKIGAAGKSIREREQSQLAKPKHQNRLSNQRWDTLSIYVILFFARPIVLSYNTLYTGCVKD